MLAVMSQDESFPGEVPDEVPLADAVEQSRAARESDDSALPADHPPLETDESDWQEQQLVVEDPEDDIR